MAFGTLVEAIAKGIIEGFQSLFFWNGLWDAGIALSSRCPFIGFNPCFSGMAFGTRSPSSGDGP